MKDLMVLQEISGDFTNFSPDAKDYLRDDFDISLESSDNVLYIGLYKPFNSFYVEGITFTDILSNLFELDFTINSTSVEVDDGTRYFSRSGFITFEKPESWASEIIDGKEAYWIRIESSEDDINVSLRGLNIVYADDTDLQTEIRNIDVLLEKGDTSFIAYHQGVRDDIIQTLRNGGHLKRSDDQIEELTKWDLLDMGEIRLAAKYLCLAKIFFDVSKNSEDKYYDRFRDFKDMYGNAFDTFVLKIDTNDDGKYEQEDDLQSTDSIEIRLG